MRAARCFSAVFAVLAAIACGASLPPRYVIEHDLGSFAYRRYQKSLEIEVPIADNPATGHTASYLRRSAKGGVAVVTAFVTVYTHAKALAAEARAALENLAGYTLTPSEVAGENVWVLDGAGRERWCVWVSNQRLVKIGVQAGQNFPHPSWLRISTCTRPISMSTGLRAKAPPAPEKQKRRSKKKRATISRCPAI